MSLSPEQMQAISNAIASPAIHVSSSSERNPVTRLIANVKWETSRDLVSDFACGATLVNFLSLQYHLLKPFHCERRLKDVGRHGRQRVLLVLADDNDSAGTTKSLLEINKLCFAHEVTCLLAWSELECARYLETFKVRRGRALSLSFSSLLSLSLSLSPSFPLSLLAATLLLSSPPSPLFSISTRPVPPPAAVREEGRGLHSGARGDGVPTQAHQEPHSGTCPPEQRGRRWAHWTRYAHLANFRPRAPHMLARTHTLTHTNAHTRPQIRSVNKTDVTRLLDAFGSLQVGLDRAWGRGVHL